MTTNKLILPLALCFNFAWSPFQLRQGIDGKVLGEYAIAEPKDVVQQIRADYAKPGEICNVLYTAELLEQMHLTNFPDPDVVYVLTLLKSPVEAVVSIDLFSHHVKMVGTKIEMDIGSHRDIKIGDCLFETIDRLNCLVYTIIVDNLQCDLMTVSDYIRLRFNAQLRDFLIRVQDKLSQIQYEKRPEYAFALHYLLCELISEPVPLYLIQYKKLADRIRPELPAQEPEVVPL